MQRTQHRVQLKPRFYGMLLVVLAVFCCLTFILAQAHYKSICDYNDSLVLQRYELKQTVSSLNDRLNYVQTDDYVMRTARDELNMNLPSEYRYVTN